MLKAKTTTARFKAPADKVQDFVGKAENLPKWATAFCLGIKKDDDMHVITTPGGDLVFYIDSDKSNGITDMISGPSREQMMRWPVRVVDDGIGGSVLMFTAIQVPGQPDDEFDGQCQALEEEFENIRRIVDG